MNIKADWGLIIASIALSVTVIGNIVAIAYFSGKQAATLKALSDSVLEFKGNISKYFDDFKNDIDNKIDKNQKHTEDHIKRLEEKQDKHNNVIERVTIVEQSTKSSHHRQDEMTKRIERIERKRP